MATGSHIRVTPDQRVYIDGHEVKGTTHVMVNVEPGEEIVEITIRPGSVLMGDPPADLIAAMHGALSAGDATVDVQRAIERAEARKKP